MIPEGWSEIRIAEAGRVVTGNTPPTSDLSYYGGSIPFVAPGDLGDFKFVSTAAKTITEKGLGVSRLLPVGATLFTCIGSTIGKIGLAAVPLTTNQQINAVVPNNDHHPEFVYYQLTQVAERIAKLAGTQAVPIISKSQFAAERILSAPYNEQRRIAEILATWDRAIETVEALIANARAQKKALMQSLLTGKHRLPGFSSAWQTVALGQICKPKQWATISAKEMTETGVPVFGANGFIGHYHSANHQGDTVVISCRGSCGEVHVVPGPSYITGNAMCLDGAADNGMQLNILAELIRRAGTQSMVSGSAQPQIVGSTVARFQITIPDAQEQIALSRILSDADDTIRTLQNQRAALRQEKSALMQQLLTGKRRVTLTEREAV
jgi:type I restriction enzyme, S subunit